MYAAGQLQLSQSGDQNGASILTLQNRTGCNGLSLQTSDATVTLTDMVFIMGNSFTRNFRLEGRAANAKTGANSFQFGGSDPVAPTVSVGDTYGLSLIHI